MGEDNEESKRRSEYCDKTPDAQNMVELGNLVGIILHMVLTQHQRKEGNAGSVRRRRITKKGSAAQNIVTRPLMLRNASIGSAVPLAQLIVTRPLKLRNALIGSAAQLIQLIVTRHLMLGNAMIGIAAQITQLIVTRPLMLGNALIGSAVQLTQLIVTRPLMLGNALIGSAVLAQLIVRRLL